jgi:hypothetical protein
VAENVRSHQPGQAAFKAILPERIGWKPVTALPPSVRLAMILGNRRRKALM